MSIEPVTRFQKFLRVLADSSADMPEPLREVEKVCCYACGHLDSYPTPNTRMEKLIASVRDESIVPPSPVTNLEKYIAAMAGYWTDELPEPVTSEEKILYDVASGEDVTLSGNPLALANALARPLKECVVSWEPTQAGSGTPYPAGSGKNLLNPAGFEDNKTINGITFTHDGKGSVKVQGTATGTAIFVLDANFDYTFSISASSSSYVVGDYVVSATGLKDGITVTRPSDNTKMYIRVGSGYTVNTTVQVQLEKGSTATDYTTYANIRPISGRDAVNVERCGENLLDITKSVENKGCTIDGNTIHIVDTSGWGSSYILLSEKYPAGTYTVQINVDTAVHGRFILRGYDSTGNVLTNSILPRMTGYETSHNTYYNATLCYAYQPPSTKKTITFTTQNAAYFRIGISGGIETGRTTAEISDFILVSGSTPPNTYTPYTGQTTTLTLPRTIYGGEVDAQTGEGQETWKLVTLDGTEAWGTWGIGYKYKDRTGFYSYSVNDYDRADISQAISSHYAYSANTYGGGELGFGLAGTGNSKYVIIVVKNDSLDISSEDTAIKSFKAYLAAQYAAGTPV